MLSLRAVLSPVLTPVRRARRRVLVHRRPLAALAAATAVLASLHAASPAPPPTRTVWTAAHPLGTGTVLTPDDLARSAWAPGTVPEGALGDPRAAVGRVLAAPMSRGEPFTTARTLGGGLLAGYPGTTAVPLRVTDAAVVDLLRVGDRVSFVVVDPDGRTPPQALVDDVAVVAIPRAGTGLASGTPGRLVVAAVPSALATEVAGRAAAGILVPVWSR